MLKRLLAFALLSCAAWAQAQSLVPVPPLTGLVTDLTGTLSAEQKDALEAVARQYEEKKGTQIGVLIVPTTEPETIEQFSIRVVDQWKLGRKKTDDGVLLLVAKDDRRVRIEVGAGLEGVLTDFASNNIIRQDITPRFKEGNFAGGIAAGMQAIMAKIDPEALPPPSAKTQNQLTGDWSSLIIVFLFLMFAASFIFRAILGRFPGSLLTGLVAGGVAWWVLGAVFIALVSGILALVFSLINSGLSSGGGRYINRGGWGGFGGFGGGGFGGGNGFGGGGGGGFSGGGSSGSW